MRLAPLLLALFAIPAATQTFEYHPKRGPASAPNVLAVGDSKSNFNTFHVYLEQYARPYHPVAVYALSNGGATVATRQATIDADLAAQTRSYSDVIINLGANDVGAMPAQATWESNLGYILDALHVKWPSARIFVMRGAWRRGFNTECATLKTWITNVLSTRSPWALPGPDETVFIENGDDGVTYSTDGTHWNGPGYQLEALKWAQSLGYHP